MDNEAKIRELTERIEKLEKAEAKRVRKAKIKIIFKIVEILVIAGVLIYGYIYINNNLIKPYKEKVDFVEEKVDTVSNFIDEKWEKIKKVIPFN